MSATAPVPHAECIVGWRWPTVHAVSELDDAGPIIASADDKVRVLRAGAGEVRNLTPWLSVDFDLDLASTSAAQMGLVRPTLRMAAEQVAHECEQLQQSHAGIAVGRVRPILQAGASAVDQVFKLWPVGRATIPAHLLTRLLMGAIIGLATPSGQ